MEINKDLIKQTWKMASTDSDKFTTSFYTKLFLKSSTIADLFASSDMKRQKQSLASTVAMVVASLDKLESLEQAIINLGKKHSEEFGVKAEYYPVVGATLIETLAEYSAEIWNQEAEDSWVMAYTFLSSLMIHPKTCKELIIFEENILKAKIDPVKKQAEIWLNDQLVKKGHFDTYKKTNQQRNLGFSYQTVDELVKGLSLYIEKEKGKKVSIVSEEYISE